MRLSKNRILDGIQCPRLLWLRIHEPNAPEFVPGIREQSLFDAGREVGERARALFPNGVLVNVERQHLERAVARTRRLVARGDVPIFEASFTAGGVFVAIDILEPSPEGWIIHEVKATTSAKPHHIVDLAVQVHVLRAAGLHVASTRLVFLDRKCRYPDLTHLFVGEDVTAQVEAQVVRIPRIMAALQGVLEDNEPAVEPGPHCRKPYSCPMTDRCAAGLPERHVGELYRLHASKRQRLISQGIRTIGEIPDDFELTSTQVLQREAIRQDELVVLPGLAERLAPTAAFPTSFLDFETISLPVPRWPGCWPWQQVPVQFSVHVERNGELEHLEYLAEAGEDPRPGLARALVEAVPREGVVLAYFEAFERGRLRELAVAVPELATELLDIEGRILDLLPVVRDHVYHPGFRGSFSIKRVVPVLCPGEGWGGLDVASGEIAMVELARLLLDGSGLTASERVRLRQALLGYCERDTRTMVALLAKLRELASRGADTPDTP